MNNVRLLIWVTIAATIFTSCRKEADESIQSAQDNAAIETEYSQVYDVVADYVSTDPKTGKTDDLILPSGATVQFGDTTFTDGDGIDFTINYGPLDHGGATTNGSGHLNGSLAPVATGSRVASLLTYGLFRFVKRPQ